MDLGSYSKFRSKYKVLLKTKVPEKAQKQKESDAMEADEARPAGAACASPGAARAAPGAARAAPGAAAPGAARAAPGSAAGKASVLRDHFEAPVLVEVVKQKSRSKARRDAGETGDVNRYSYTCKHCKVKHRQDGTGTGSLSDHLGTRQALQGCRGDGVLQPQPRRAVCTDREADQAPLHCQVRPLDLGP
jgi:hypothetical protein